jgi:hypothetical protein
VGPSIERLAYEAILGVLRADAGLRAAGVTIWPNRVAVAPEDTTPLADQLPHRGNRPNRRELPVVRVWPIGVQNCRRETERSHYTELVIRFECFALGDVEGDAMDLWGAVRDALWPLEVDPANAVNAVLKINTSKGRTLRGRLRVQLGTIESFGEDDYGQVAESSIVFPIEVVTT